MKTKPYLTLRSNEPYYKIFGIFMALWPTVILSLIFGINLISRAADLYALNAGAKSITDDPDLSIYFGVYFILGVPMTVYVICAAYFAVKFSKQQFSDLYLGQVTSFKDTAFGWAKAFTRAHVIYLIVSSLCFVLLILFLLLFSPYGENVDLLGSGLGRRIGKTVAYLLKWALLNIPLWLVVTLPLSFVSSLILRVICLKRMVS